MAGYTWPDGSRGHSVPYAQHKANMDAAEKSRQQQSEQAIKTAAQNRAPGAPTPSGVFNTSPVGDPLKGVGAVSGPPPELPAAPGRKPFEFQPDADYDNAISLNRKKYEDATANLDSVERQTKFDFGIDDPTNPFSRQVEMKRLALKQSNGTKTSMNSAGLLQSGAYLRALDRNKRSEDKGAADLRAAYEAALDEVRRARTSNKTAQEEADAQARADSYNRQLAAYNAQ